MLRPLHISVWAKCNAVAHQVDGASFFQLFLSYFLGEVVCNSGPTALSGGIRAAPNTSCWLVAPLYVAVRSLETSI